MTEQLKKVIKALNDLKLKDIIVYDFRTYSPLFDYMVIASGSSERQVLASIRHLTDALPDTPIKVEGASEGRWLLFDLSDIIVNVMHQDERDYYQLDKLFFQRDTVNIEELGL
jgi:ribosome-associated protein